MPRFILFTNTGRSATKYMTAVCSEILGEEKCGHEDRFGVQPALGPGGPLAFGGKAMDSSWHAPPIVARRRLWDDPRLLIVHQLRDPLKSVGSMWGIGKLKTGSPGDQLVFQHSPVPLERMPDPDRLAWHWCHWHLWIDSFAETTIQTERLCPVTLAAVFSLAGYSVGTSLMDQIRNTLATVPKTTNHRINRAFDPLMIQSAAIRRWFERTAAMFGYPLA